ncbi:MAG: adenylate/guanylate cyclase domain-containing protein [Elusimicrobia bacterium]|nr:adenylate/guanylate cyclase domain-containing protein [Elusimicrobiota bacterium]
MKKEIMAVGLADLTKYARIVDAVGSEKAVDFLLNAFKIAGDSIIKYGCRIRKYIGDSILFTSEDPFKAVSAADEIVKSRLPEINSLSSEFSAAVATGETILAKIGHPSYLTDDVMGNSVNTAFRMAGFNSGINVLMDENTYNMVKDKITASEEIKTKFKGMEKEIKVYRLIGVKRAG